MKFLSMFLLVASVVVSTVACRSNDVGPEPTNAAVPSAATKAAPSASSSQAKLARVVFLDKEKCCQCTRDRTDASWAALQGALAGRRDTLPVERIHVDTQPDQVAKYRSQRPFVAIPAIYLLDGSGNVVELLQGELTQAQVSAALEKP